MDKSSGEGGDTHYKGWKYSLQELINKYNPFREDGKRPTSHKTQSERAKFLFKMFKDLHAMGLKVMPHNLKHKHIQAMCNKFMDDDLSPATIQLYMTFMRHFCMWIGKRELMRLTATYFPDESYYKRTCQATRDKSWEGNGIDKEAVFHEISTKFPWVWIQMLMIDAFGLRLREAVCMRPYMNEKNGFLFVYSGAKGGRARTIEIETEYQREVLSKAQSFVGRTSKFLADPTKSLTQNQKKITNTMSNYKITKSGKGALGVTLHGLRSGFAMRKLEAAGIGQIFRKGSITVIPPEDEMVERMRVSNDLGHNRAKVLNAYVPETTDESFAKIKQAQAAEIIKWLAKVKRGERYMFGLILDPNPSLNVVPDGFVERTFIQVAEVEGGWIFHVEEGEDFEGNMIPIEHVVNIRHL